MPLKGAIMVFQKVYWHTPYLNPNNAVDLLE